MTGAGAPAAASRDSTQGPALGPGVLAIAGLASLAVAQPIYDVLRRAPEFFAIRGLLTADVLALIGLLALAPTLLLSLPALIVRLAVPARPTWTRTAVALTLGPLVAVIVLQATPGMAASLAATFALAAGAATAWSYSRHQATRSFALLLSAAVVAAPALLLLDTRVRESLSAPASPSIQRATGAQDSGARAPVVLVVFDEWSLTSVLDANGRIDGDRLPNLRRLADASTWYPNATAAADVSELALPAMLSGSRAERGALPTLAERPDNLFTALAPTHDLYAKEAITSLCPPEANLLAQQKPALGERLGLLLSDLKVLWLQVTLPSAWSGDLPSVTRTWSNFEGSEPSAATRAESRDTATAAAAPTHDPVALALQHLRRTDRAAAFRQFVAAIEPPRDRPAFYFLHSMLPHLPWEYLPSGRSYRTPHSRVHGLDREFWDDDPWPALHYRKRYLLQVEFVDKLIGELLDRLEAQGLFDDSVIVITADHGVAFRPGRSRRLLELTDLEGSQTLDLAAVPLIVKAPRQQLPAVDRTPISLAGLAPLVLKLAGADPDAVELPSAPPEPADGALVIVGKYAEDVHLAADRSSWLDREGAELAELLGANDDPMAIGVRPDLHERRIAALPQRTGSYSVLLEAAERWRDVALGQTTLPAIVHGTFDGPPGAVQALLERTAAVALNGVIAATVKPHRGNNRTIRLTALLPERLFVAGRNEVEVYLLPAGGGNAEPTDEPELERVTRASIGVYELTESPVGTGEALLRRSSDAADEEPRFIPVFIQSETRLVGFLDGDGSAAGAVQGWAVDLLNPGKALEIVIFLNGEPIWNGATSSPRAGVAERYGDEYLYSGFYRQPGFGLDPGSRRARRLLETMHRDGVVAYAVADRGIATKLRILYSDLEEEEGREILPITDGRRLTLAPADSRVGGFLDSVSRSGTRTEITGWAADIQRGEPPLQFVVYRDGDYLTRFNPLEERPDVVQAHGDDDLLRSGFLGSVPGGPDPETFRENHRVFGVLQRGVAVELPM